MGFLHGVETIELLQGPVPINEVKSAVIGVIGTALEGEPYKMHVIRSRDEIEPLFGKASPGFTLYNALDAIFDHVQTTVLAVNVFDVSTDKVSETETFDKWEVAGSLYYVQLPHNNVRNVKIGIINPDNPGSEIVGLDDYYQHISVDYDNGIVQRLDTFPVTQAELEDPNAPIPFDLYISYDYLNVSNVTNVIRILEHVHIFESALSQFGFFPKILIAPGFSHEAGVGPEMLTVANPCRAMALIDIPEDKTPEEAVQIKQAYNSDRCMICYPKIKFVDPLTGTESTDWLSSRAAGLMAKVDKEEGYHVSPSNHVLEGITGVERLLSYIPNNENTELNYVNSQGIVSVLNFYGSGYRLFGNRTAAFPFMSDPLNTFICWRRVADILEESIEYYTLQFLDKPMFTNPMNVKNDLLIKIQDSVNDFIRILRGRGVLVDGECTINTDDNPTTALANGQLTYRYYFTPPVPAERITYKAIADIEALSTVFATITNQ